MQPLMEVRQREERGELSRREKKCIITVKNKKDRATA